MHKDPGSRPEGTIRVRQDHAIFGFEKESSGCVHARKKIGDLVKEERSQCYTCELVTVTKPQPRQ